MPLSTAYQLEQQTFETSLELKKLRHRCGQLHTALTQTQGHLREERRKAQELAGYAVKLKKKVQYYRRVMREHKMREEGEVSSSSGGEGDGGEIQRMREAFGKSEEIRRQQKEVIRALKD